MPPPPGGCVVPPPSSGGANIALSNIPPIGGRGEIPTNMQQ